MTYKKFFSLAKSKNITNIQIVEKTIKSSQIELINNRIDDYSDRYIISYDIKAEYNGKTVKASVESLNESIINLLIEKAIFTDSKYQDQYLDKRIIKNCDKKIKIDITNEIKILKNLYKLSTKYTQINSFNTSFNQTYQKIRIVNSKGLDISTDSCNYEFYVSVSASKNEEKVTYSNATLKVKKEEIYFEEIAKDAINKALMLLDQKRIETKKYDIILNSYVAYQIISNIANMLSSRSNRMKISCLSNKLNKKVFSDKLTIIEEPLSKKFPGYSVFDDEGTPTYNKTLIERGKIKQYLYNNNEAKLKNTLSTGNGYSNIETRNMYIKPGSNTKEALLTKLNNGLYIVDCMGAQGTAINQSSGNISLQVFGYIVKNGKISGGFCPVILSTTFKELLSNIKEIGKDLEFYSKSSGSPSMYIKDISIVAQ